MLLNRTALTRAIAMTLAASLAAALSGCASGPASSEAPPAPQAAQATGETTFNTGRLTVHVTDQNGRPLDRTNIDVTGDGGYRGTGVTNRDGRVQFNNVPPRVQVSAINQGGSFSQNFNVPPNSSSEMRMIIDIIEIEQPADPAADQAGGY